MAGAVASKTLLSFKRRLLLGKVRLKLFGGWLPETSGDAGGRKPVISATIRAIDEMSKFVQKLSCKSSCKVHCVLSFSVI